MPPMEPGLSPLTPPVSTPQGGEGAQDEDRGQSKREERTMEVPEHPQKLVPSAHWA